MNFPAGLIGKFMPGEDRETYDEFCCYNQEKDANTEHCEGHVEGRVCDDGSHQRKQEVCSGEQRNCAPARQEKREIKAREPE